MQNSSTSLSVLSSLLDQARALGADGADAVLYETIDLSLSQRLGKPEGLERSENRAVGLRVLTGGRQAMASATDLSPASLAELAERAVAMAKAAPPDPDSTLAAAELLATNPPELELFDPKEPSPEWLRDQCTEAEETARATPGITNSEGAEAHFGQSRISLAIAGGKGVYFARSYPVSHASISVSVVAGEGTGMERDYEFTSAHHVKDLAVAAEVGRSAAERALKRLNPRKAQSCRAPIVFDPRISRNLLSILASAISGTAIARGSSFLKDAMGQDIFSPHVTIVDDPHIKRGLGSKPFDGEGVRNGKRLLVDKGVLQTWLLDIRTANKLKLATTGHASRGVGSPPSPASSNLYMAKGKVSPEELIRDIESGLYVTETFGTGVNTTTGDYSQGASGFWIEKGKIAWPVSEITIAGNLREMFKQATPADDLVFRYATNAPTVRIDSMTVAGV